MVTAAIEIVPIDLASGAPAPSLGTWLVSDALGAPQTFSCAGRTWQLVMRPARYYKPYSVTLQKFTHERYAGTEIPKNFASRITLIDPERAVDRDVLIYMNHPLRYRGETFYQAGFQKDDSASILQVVHNPSFIAPYIACVIVAAGLLVQFGYHLVGFSRRTRMHRMKRFFPAVVWRSSPLLGRVRLAPAEARKQRGRSVTVRQDSGAGRRPRQTARYRCAEFAADYSLKGNAAAWTMAGRSARSNGWPTRSFNAPVADQYPAFVIQNAEVLGLVRLATERSKIF